MSRTPIAATPHGVDAARYAYQAFISYSHAADGKLAEALQRALQRFAKAWHQRRAIRVFRDTTGLTVTPDLWDAIRDALASSEYFILLASERAAQSRWVELEIETWLTIASPDRLLIVWTDGELVWDHERGDFDWSRTTCLNDRLQGVFDGEPLYLDLRWARTSADLSPRRPEFLDAVARLSSALRHVPFDDLVGEEIRQHRRTRRLAASAIAGLTVLLISAVAAGMLAVRQRDAARRRLVDLTLASGARELERGDLSAAALWFVQALGYETGRDNLELHRLRVRNALSMHPALLHAWTADATVQARWAIFSPDARYVLSDGLQADGVSPGRAIPYIWDVEHGDSIVLRLPAVLSQRVLATHAAGDRVSVLTTDSSNNARLLDARAATVLATFAHPAAVVAASFSDDGALLLTEASDHIVRVWTTNGQLLHTLAHESELLGAVLTRDRQRVVSSTADNTAHIWSLPANGETAAHIAIPHDESVQQIDVSSGGRFVITVANRGARLFDLAAEGGPEHLNSWIAINHAEFSPDGSQLLLAGYGDATLFMLDPLDELASVHAGALVLHAAFSPDGERFATAGTDRVARVWDARTGEPATPPLFHEGTATHVAFNADGSRLSTATAAGLVRVWNLRVTPPPMRHEYVQRAQFHNDRRYLLSIGNADAMLWDLQRDTALTLAGDSQLYHAAFSPDGRRIVTCMEDGTARLWDMTNGHEIMTLQHDRRVQHASFHPTRAWLMTAGAAGQDDSEVSIWDLGTGEKLFSLPPSQQRASRAWFNADGTRILTHGAGGASLWDASSRNRLPVDSLDDARIVSFSPDGEWFVVQHGLGSVRVYDAANGAPVSPHIEHEHAVIDRVSFGTDSKTVLVVGGGFARLWDARTGAARTPPLRNESAPSITFAAMSADGRFIATAATASGTVRLWDARTGQALSGAFAHANVGHVAFSEDASLLATTGSTVRVWQLSDPAADAPAEQSETVARVLAARRIDETGAVVPLDATQFRAAWASLRTDTPPARQ